MTITADTTGALKTRGMLLGSSPTLDGAKRLIASFYCTEPERIHLTRIEGAREQRQWTVAVGDRAMDAVRVFPHRGRFQFAKCEG